MPTGEQVGVWSGIVTIVGIVLAWLARALKLRPEARSMAATTEQVLAQTSQTVFGMAEATINRQAAEIERLLGRVAALEKENGDLESRLAAVEEELAQWRRGLLTKGA